MSNSNTGAAASGGAIYGRHPAPWCTSAQADFAKRLAVIQGLFWPAWMVYELFDTLAA